MNERSGLRTKPASSRSMPSAPAVTPRLFVSKNVSMKYPRITANRPDCITYHNPGWKTARSLHPGGANLLFCDGHVTFLKNSIQLSTWRALSTRNGGEVISADSY